MTTSAAGPSLGRLQAPTEDRGELVVPPLSAVATLLAENQSRLRTSDAILAGVRLLELSRQARTELLVAAHHYSSAYRDVPPPTAEAPVILAGHQPQMFHVGVWCKNFLLARIAREHRATAINLIVDNDTLKSASLLVPGGSVAHPQVQAVEYDAAAEAVPFEERQIVDRSRWQTFAERAAAFLQPLVAAPMLADFWPLVMARSRETNNLGACLAQARHQWEGRLGQNTLELPQSVVCELPAFCRFVSHMLREAASFRETHNAALANYRRENRVRSTRHPVPDLARDGEWLETPFWIWQAGDPRRRRLFVRRAADMWQLTDRGAVEFSLPADSRTGGGPAVEELAALAGRGVKLRTRALMTTLWSRLALCDMFVHGIGGAKYDQLTDELLRRFFGVEPLRFLVATATLRLPIDRPRVTADDLRRLDSKLRELTFHPERFLSPSNSPSDSTNTSGRTAADWIAIKRRAIDESFTRSSAQTRCHTIRAANGALQDWLVEERRKSGSQRASLSERLRAEAVLASREYGFPIFPTAVLQDFLLEFPSRKAYI